MNNSCELGRTGHLGTKIPNRETFIDSLAHVCNGHIEQHNQLNVNKLFLLPSDQISTWPHRRPCKSGTKNMRENDCQGQTDFRSLGTLSEGVWRKVVTLEQDSDASPTP